MSNWDKSQPGGREPISSGAMRIREIKDALETTLGEEHDFTLGYHKFPYGDTATGYEGRWRFNNVLGRIERYVSGAWEAITLEINIMPTGTKTLFFQAAAPTGWTQDTTFGDDEFLRVVSSGAISSGGSWGPSTENYVSNHYHTRSENLFTVNKVGATEITLTHSATYPDIFDATGSQFMVLPDNHIVYDGGVSNGHSHFEGAGGSHLHVIDPTWRPAYVDVLVATKD